MHAGPKCTNVRTHNRKRAGEKAAAFLLLPPPFSPCLSSPSNPVLPGSAVCTNGWGSFKLWVMSRLVLFCFCMLQQRCHAMRRERSVRGIASQWPGVTVGALPLSSSMGLATQPRPSPVSSTHSFLPGAWPGSFLLLLQSLGGEGSWELGTGEMRIRFYTHTTPPHIHRRDMVAGEKGHGENDGDMMR